MDIGEVLTRGTVWLALSFYVGGEAVGSNSEPLQRRQLARILNSAGCVLFIAHVTSAFHFYHHWSHTAAYAETARQTSEYFGVNWGGGIYFNYVFLGLWLVQVIASWTRPVSPQQGVGWLSWVLRGFVLMMILNGAVIFAHGPMRWLGLLLCVLLVASWRRR